MLSQNFAVMVAATFARTAMIAFVWVCGILDSMTSAGRAQTPKLKGDMRTS